ncbi:MAG: acyl-CoA synthetase FdrA [Pelolinea sp.]|nr:acyl-CoA synthetase FdrA [Pelolinea sp.]
MGIHTLIKTSEYHDSVTLMSVAKELTAYPGVGDAAVIMGTESNISLLKESGLYSKEVEKATPNDLIITFSSPQELKEKIFIETDRLLNQKPSSEAGAAEHRPRTIGSAIKAHPDLNMAVISVAGRYATGEAWNALRNGLHVLLFSDNVSLNDEIALKKYARDHGLLLMGPGAGTALINGIALGFANIVPKGPVGIVSAAGTGLQEVSTLLAKSGVGITQGIGTGGRDLSEDVGGIMMLESLKALQADPNTKVIALISKPPSKGVAEVILDQVANGNKPTIVGFMGSNPDDWVGLPNAFPAKTLEETALLAAKAVRSGIKDPFETIKQQTMELKKKAFDLGSSLGHSQRYLRGLFSGGTLCYEAQVIWKELIPDKIYSNAPLRKEDKLSNSNQSQGHTVVDLGEEEFTVGRPHPMIDNDLRIRRLLQEAKDPEVAVIIMDVVLGYGAHPNPASELGPAARRAIELAKNEGREIIIVSSVTGTEQDPQVLSKQTAILSEYGVIVCESNAAAARLVGMIVNRD